MLLLQANQVQICPVQIAQAQEPLVFSGLVYREQLFSRIESYPLSQRETALKAARTYADKMPNHGGIILVEEATALSIWQADTTLRRYVEADTGLPINPATVNLEALVEQMRSPQGLPICDRNFWFKPQRRIFKGQDLVQWLHTQYNCSETVAQQIGQRLLQAGWIYQLEFKRNFKGDRSLYRFYVDELEEG